MAANPYTLPKTPQVPKMPKMPESTKIGWYDWDQGVREQILRHSHPAKTVAVEYVDYQAPIGIGPLIIRFEFTRERKRVAGPDLLKIRITRHTTPGHEAAAGHTYSGTWHNVSKIRLHSSITYARYTFEFIGKDADGLETSYYPPEWVYWRSRFYVQHHHNFDELGLTVHRTRDQSGAQVLEYRF